MAQQVAQTFASMMQLHELVERVDSRERFLVFVAALQADLRSAPADWENPSLDRYLAALEAWASDMGARLPESPSWRTFADILYAARIYE